MAQHAYSRILKGTALFGGVQVLQILIQLVRGKTSALFIGAVGIGLNGIYTSSLAMLITIAGLGCNLSGMRYLSGLSQEAPDYLTRVRYVQRVFLLLAALGCVLTLLLSVPLSYAAFGDADHVWAYCVLSIYVAATMYASGGVAILQGMQQLQRIAVGNVLPAAVGLTISVPLYYIWGVQAVVPVLLVVPCLSAMYLHMQIRQLVGTDHTPLQGSELHHLMRDFVALGIVTVLAALLGNITMFAINSFIAQTGSVQDVGFYQAGTSITNQYVGLIFSAMAVDYFPRLAQVQHDREQTNSMVNEQGEITILLAWPLLAIMMLTAPVIIRILLSSEFLVINSFIQIIAFGMIFKAASFCLGYISFAKGDKRTYFWLEGIVGNACNLLISIVSYWLYGLQGLAISFLVNYGGYLLLVYRVTHWRYGYQMGRAFSRLTVAAAVTLALLLGCLLQDGWGWLAAAVLLTAVIIGVALCLLNRRVPLAGIVQRVYHRFF